MIAVLQVDPQGAGCLREQMCHPLATVVLFPQCPGGSSLGEMMPRVNRCAIGTRTQARRRRSVTSQQVQP